ncbi:MAG: putative PEP-binding protein [Tunicatimonas sp.]
MDHDLGLLSDLFSARDPAVKKMIREVIAVAQCTNTNIGLCGQAPSDDLAFAQFLVEAGMHCMFFHPDALVAKLGMCCRQRRRW